MLRDYLLEENLPHFWCAGCGSGIVLQSLLRNIDKQGWKREDTVVVTGIGCWGKADDYIKTNTFHGTTAVRWPFPPGSSWRIPTCMCSPSWVTATGLPLAATT